MSTNIYFIIVTLLIDFSFSREHLYDTSDRYLLQEKTESTTTDGDFVDIESNTVYINYQDNETSTDDKNLVELEHVIDPPRISSQMSPDIETVALSLMEDEDQQRVVSIQRYSSITDAAHEDLGVEPREVEPREVEPRDIGYSTSNLAKGSPLRALVANRKVNRVNLNKNDILKLKQKYYKKTLVTEKYPATEDKKTNLLSSLNDIKQLIENSTSKCHVQSLNAEYKSYKDIINLKIKYIRSDLNNFIKNNEKQDALMMGNIESFRLVLNNQETRFKNYEVNFDKIKQQCNQNCPQPGTFSLKKTYDHKVSLPHPIASFYAGYTGQQNFRASDAGNSTDSTFQHKTALDMKKINENISYLRDTVDNFSYNFEQFSSDHTNSTLEQNNLETGCKCSPNYTNTKLDTMEEKLEKQIENAQNDMEQRILKLEGKFDTENTLQGVEDNTEHSVTAPASSSAAKDQELSARVTELERKFADMQSLKETVALLSQQVRAAANKTVCVWPYRRHHDTCLHVSSEERLSWYAARTRCEQLQGDLATVTDGPDFRKYLATQRTSRSYSFWIGGSYSNSANWVWTDGSSVSQKLWSSSQPVLNRPGACMEIRPDQRLFSGTQLCRVPNYFICQQAT